MCGVQQLLPARVEAAQVIGVLPPAAVIDGRKQFQIDVVEAAGDVNHEGTVGSCLDPVAEPRWQSAAELRCRAAVEPVRGEPELPGDSKDGPLKLDWQRLGGSILAIAYQGEDIEILLGRRTMPSSKRALPPTTTISSPAPCSSSRLPSKSSACSRASASIFTNVTFAPRVSQVLSYPGIHRNLSAFGAPLLIADEAECFRRLQLALPAHHAFPQVAFATLLTDDGRLSRQARWSMRGSLRVVALVELDDPSERIRGGEGEIGAGVEGRVDVDQVDRAGELGEEDGEDLLLVAPDQAVAPFGVASLGEEVEHELAGAGGLVDRLDGLEGEGQAGGGDALAPGVVLAVPDQLGHGGLPPLGMVDVVADIRIDRGEGEWDPQSGDLHHQFSQLRL